MPFHEPPIPPHDDASEMIPPVAYAGCINCTIEIVPTSKTIPIAIAEKLECNYPFTKIFTGI